MTGLNTAFVSGNLVSDAKYGVSKTGKPYAIATIASNYSIKKADGSFEEKADYVPVVAHGYLSERLMKGTKGAEITVTGKIVSFKKEVDGKKMTEVMVELKTINNLRNKQKDGTTVPTTVPATPTETDTEDDFDGNLVAGQISTDDLPF